MGTKFSSQNAPGIRTSLDTGGVPGGKPEPGESDPETLKRELKEELDIDVNVRKSYYSVTHDYEDRTVHLRFYTCTMDENTTPEPVECEEIRWVPEHELTTLSFPPADNELITKLQQESSASD